MLPRDHQVALLSQHRLFPDYSVLKVYVCIFAQCDSLAVYCNGHIIWTLWPQEPHAVLSWVSFQLLWHFQHGHIIILIHHYGMWSFCSFNPRNCCISTDYKKKISNYFSIWHLNVTSAEDSFHDGWASKGWEESCPFPQELEGPQRSPHIVYIFF